MTLYDAEASPRGAGLMLLLWQEPTDRALAGWCPQASWVAAACYQEPTLLQWLERSVRLG